jgi:hypothetical protein
MKTPELALVYLLVGLGLSAAWGLRSRPRAEVIDLALLLLFWPLYGPFLVTAPRRSAFAGLMPDPALIEDLERRLEQARMRGDAIGALLCDPAMLGAESLRAKLEAMRARFQTEVVAGEDLLGQLRLRERALRLAGSEDLSESTQMLDEVRTRIEVLDQMLA